MKISKIVKPLAVIGAAAMLAGAAGCSDTSWSFKTDAKTISAGEWIYYTYAAYNQAVSKVDEENYDGKDIDKKTIEKKDGYTWIEDEAKDSALAHMTVEKLIKDNKVKIDDSELKLYKSQYSYYYKMSEELYTKLGVSEDSFADINAIYPYKSQKLFEYLYGEKGPKAVSEDEIKKYYEDNYVNYYYVGYSLVSTDDDGNAVDVDDETIDKVTLHFDTYAKQLNDGKTVEDIEELYKKDFEVESVPSTNNTAVLDDANISDEIKETIKGLEVGKAATKKIDGSYYLIYKGDAASKFDEVTDEENGTITKTSILYSMKNDEYKDYLKKEQKKLKYETNDASLAKYNVSRTVSIVTSN